MRITFFMRIILSAIFAVLLLGPTGPAFADSKGGDPVKTAMAALKKNHFEEAVSVLSSALGTPAASTATFNLAFGTALLEGAKLHRDLYALSLKFHTGYLKRLTTAKVRERSRYARLYLAEALLLSDKAGRFYKAASQLEKFIADRKVDAADKDVARAVLALAFHKQGKKKKALVLWASIKTTDPEVLSELASAYALSDVKRKESLSLAERALSLSKGGPTPRTIKNLLGVHAKEGLIDEGLKLLRATDLKAHSFEETIGENKVIRFYDISLLKNLSDFYATAGVEYLKKAAKLKKTAGIANFYLGNAYSLLGRYGASNKALRAAIDSGRIPTQLKHKAEVMLAENTYARGKKTKAVNRLRELSTAGSAPALLAEVLFACAEMGQSCSGTAIRAEHLLSGSGGGKRLTYLSHALGSYHLSTKDYAGALTYLEGARDKSNKNKVEFNSPVLLTMLAEAYYGTKQFSEALEIFFEMSSHFQALRQLQVTLQGIYSIEQKSAGDVKIQ